MTNPIFKPEQEITASGKGNTIEVHFVDIILFAKKYFKTFLMAAIASGIIGFVLSFLLTKKYESRILLLPEYGSAKRSSFSILTAGLNADGAEKLLPELYPTILQSTPFGSFLLQQPVKDHQDRAYKSFQSFLNRNLEKKSSGFFQKIFSSSKEKPAPSKKLSYQGVLSYSSEEQLNIARTISSIKSSVDQKTGIIEIRAETEDPFVSAIIVEIAKQYLVRYVEDYRTTKELQNVSTLKERVNEAKRRLRQSEVTLQTYRGRNRNTFSNVARLEEQRLQSEYLLAESLYSDLTRRFEQAKITAKDEKPVFKVLEPAKVPLSKSSPKRFRFGIFAALLGVVLCLLYILFIKEKIMDKIWQVSKIQSS